MNVFELFAKLGLDTSEYERGLQGAESKLSGFGKTLASGVGAAAKAGAVAVGATATAVGALAQQSTSAFAEFEQLEGGIQTLFGSAAPKVMTNAEQAFKTAGQSMNQYMETSIQSAASLINSLDGNQTKAAELMDMSIVDMMDNVNKMGTSLEGVQNAYRGFSRGNFTMLDNLALGFAGTKEGMQELLDKAEELSGVEYNVNSYADIVQAIHVVQEEMGVAGTTMKEGTETISGSLSTLGSAWENLVAGFSKDGADLDKLIGDVVTSATTVLDNVTPVFEKALNGISTFISKAAPIIAKEIPKVVNDVLPTLLDAAMNLVKSLADSLPSIIQTLLQVLQQVVPELSSVIKDLIPALMKVIKESSPALVQIGMQLVLDLINGAIEILPMIADIGLQAIVQLVNGISSSLPTLIPAIVEVMLAIVDTLLNNIDLLIDAALQLVIGLTEGIIAAMPILIDKMPELVNQVVQAIVDNLPMLIEAIGTIMLALAEAVIANAPQILAANGEVLLAIGAGILEAIPALITAMGTLYTRIGEFVGGKVKEAIQWGKDLIKNFIDGIKAKFNDLRNVLVELGKLVVSLVGFSEPEEGPLSKFHTFAPDMMDLFAQGIRQNEDVVDAQIRRSFNFENTIKGTLPDLNTALEFDPIVDASPADLASDNNSLLEGQFGQAVELLSKLVDKEPVEIGANASGIFDLVRKQNGIYAKAYGRSALT